MSVSPTNTQLVVTNGTPSKKTLWQWSENYLSVGSKHYQVSLAPDKTLYRHISEKKAHWFVTALKILSFITVVLPIVALVTRQTFRKSGHSVAFPPKPPGTLSSTGSNSPPIASTGMPPSPRPISVRTEFDEPSSAEPQSSAASCSSRPTYEGLSLIEWWQVLERETDSLNTPVFHPSFKMGTKENPFVDGRFTNVLCPTHTVAHIFEASIGQFIALHANRVKLADGSPYILTQAPLEQTVELFWKTCLEMQSPLIVDLTGPGDRSRDPTVISYYPEEVGGSKTYRTIKITCTKQQRLNNQKFILSTYTVTDSGADPHQTKEITRLHNPTWKDYEASSLKDLHHLIELVDALSKDRKDAPVTVHCRAGVGRTGTFVTARALNHLKETLTPKNFRDVLSQAILDGRQQRGDIFVQSEAQFKMLVLYAMHILKIGEHL